MRIGEIARATGVRVDTVRFYERRGLLRPPARTRAGYRDYPAQVAERIRWIRRAQELGFTLAEISAVLRSARGAGIDCAALRDGAARKLAEIDAALGALARRRDALARVVDGCAAPAAERSCAALVALEAAAR